MKIEIKIEILSHLKKKINDRHNNALSADDEQCIFSVNQN